ncbi:hypothetical protein [Olleya aquimaris]|uniref:Selenophosphate synthetase n=1 Tax=Olleya aquimaris TaxID=639310 RepID=A0A327RGC7_9FLAO|nr:hypothetical protein [Olleya aquimaris]RAJ14503.1 hypothetical protein LY08_01678 [Olleya aquimaris]
MKNQLLTALIICSLISCKNNAEKKSQSVQLTTAEKIAKAHGIDHWANVSQLNFTFNVDRDTVHFERSWIWKPKTQDVTLITSTDTISFNRTKLDSTSIKADQGFINDKYWLLAPFQLVWDSGTTITDSINSMAPISKATLNKLTITYGNDGGYTPGDAYDFFYDDNYKIKEWIFRKGNTQEPSMITTFENYEEFNGINIAKDHKKPDGNWKLYFTNISIKTE